MISPEEGLNRIRNWCDFITHDLNIRIAYSFAPEELKCKIHIILPDNKTELNFKLSTTDIVCDKFDYDEARKEIEKRIIYTWDDLLIKKKESA